MCWWLLSLSEPPNSSPDGLPRRSLGLRPRSRGQPPADEGLDMGGVRAVPLHREGGGEEDQAELGGRERVESASPPPPEPDWWVLAVLLCPGDTTEAVAAWARQGRAPVADRIHFYLHPHTNPVEAFAAWYAAGHQEPRTAEVEDFATFHKQFGWDLNNQVYRDAVAKA